MPSPVVQSLSATEAAKEIVEGVRVSVDWPLDSMSIPCFGRSCLEHTIKKKEGRTVNDDILTFNTQSSSQWDGFRHYGHQGHKVFYNGVTQEEVESTNRAIVASGVNR